MAVTNHFATPSYAQRKKTPGFTPAPTAGPFSSAASTLPLRSGARAAEGNLLRRGSTLSTKYQGERTRAIAGARAGLEGIGGYKVGDDGTVSSDPNARTGERQKASVRSELEAANAAGIQDSSFARKNVGLALARLDAEAQAVIAQHAATFNNLVVQEAAEYDEINSGLLQLYGDEAQYAIDNPPPPDPAIQAQEDAEQGQRDAAAAAAPKRQVMALPNSKKWTPAQVDRWHAAHPSWNLKKRGDGSWVAVKEGN